MLDRFDEAVPLARGPTPVCASHDGRFGEWRLAEIASLQDDHDASGTPPRAVRVARRMGLLGYLSRATCPIWDKSCASSAATTRRKLARRGHQLAEGSDVTASAAWRRVQLVCAPTAASTPRRERLAREALAISEDTDGLNDQGEALCDLAEILVAAGRGEEAADALAAALERFERKENIPMARRTRTQLMALRAGTSSV